MQWLTICYDTITISYGIIICMCIVHCTILSIYYDMHTILYAIVICKYIQDFLYVMILYKDMLVYSVCVSVAGLTNDHVTIKWKVIELWGDVRNNIEYFDIRNSLQ